MFFSQFLTNYEFPSFYYCVFRKNLKKYDIVDKYAVEIEMFFNQI